MSQLPIDSMPASVPTDETPTDALTDDALTDDALTDRVRVWQRRRGHRYSVDDVVTAWTAIRGRPGATSYLDLGCGIGSVLLMVADRLTATRAAGVEAQAVSFELARRNVERNALASRIELQHGDLRDSTLLERMALRAPGGFELVTGTPPYKPLGSATVSPDSQRAHARVELRGGVEAYLQAAARVLAADGLFVMCAESALHARVCAGAELARLHIAQRLDVVPMAAGRAGGEGRLFCVYSCVRAAGMAPPDDTPRVTQLVLREVNGARTAAAHALRQFFGLSIDPHEAPSPARARSNSQRGARSELS